MEEVNNINLINLGATALIGDVVEMCELCLSDKRPGCVYMHFFRSSHKKIAEFVKIPEVPRDFRYNLLMKLLEYYNTHPNCTVDIQKNMSNDLLNIIKHNGRNN